MAAIASCWTTKLAPAVYSTFASWSLCANVFCVLAFVCVENVLGRQAGRQADRQRQRERQSRREATCLRDKQRARGGAPFPAQGRSWSPTNCSTCGSSERARLRAGHSGARSRGTSGPGSGASNIQSSGASRTCIAAAILRLPDSGTLPPAPRTYAVTYALYTHARA